MNLLNPFPALFCAVLLAAQPLAAGQSDADAAALAAAREQAGAGDRIAQFSLGSLEYWSGGDLAQAEKWLRMAAEQGYAPAEFELSLLLERSSSRAEEASDWLLRAAEHGFPPAQRAQGDRYRVGLGLAPDSVKAAGWYRRAADAGDLRAQYHLAQLYFDGVGVARDYVQAYVWFDRAAAQTPLEDNWKALLELRDIAAARMSPAELEAARRLAGESLRVP